MNEPALRGSDLGERYAAPAPWRRRALIAGVALAAIVFLCWVAWASWVQGTPAAESQLVSFEVSSDNLVIAHVEIKLDDGQLKDGQLKDGAQATCRVRAFSEDHTTVGEVSFTPQQGAQDVEIRTERRATSVDLVGCTTPDQLRPR